jgi:uroporphyrinogen III methyltransferase/synthase
MPPPSGGGEESTTDRPLASRGNGIVYLVGAGPGDPGLITVRGLACLQKAEVVVCDRLVNQRLLEHAPSGCEIIDVGKTPQKHPIPQREINALLIDRARAGKVVVRLKGGDPFLFGRGGEEAEALAEAGIPFQVVPGITSAIAVPAYAGIPVTHRDFTSTFAVVTGHEDLSKDSSDIDWAKLATGAGTLVFLMAIGNLPAIVAKLMEHGRDPQTPVAVIRWGTEPRQETVTGTLVDIVQRVREAGLQPPAVTVVGDVVRLREKLRWFDTMPLFGKRVLVTRARSQASALSQRLRELGAEPVELPAIAIVPPSDWSKLDQALDKLSSYDWVIFTSANGVQTVAERLRALGGDLGLLDGPRVAAIGPATAQALQDHGLRVDFVPPVYVAEEIAAGIGDVRGQRVLLPRADKARPALAQDLRRKGALVDEVVAYRTTPSISGDLRAILGNGKIDIVTFTSSSTVKNLAAALGKGSAGEALNGMLVACIGPVTARTAQELGIHVDVVAPEHTIRGLVDAIVDTIGDEHGHERNRYTSEG